MDEDLINEIIATQGVTPEQAAYIARTIQTGLAEYAEAWNAEARTERDATAQRYAADWDQAARRAGNAAANPKNFRVSGESA